MMKLDALEHRLLLSTVIVADGDGTDSGGISTAAGVTANWSPGDDASGNYSYGGFCMDGSEEISDTYTIDLSSLPAHTMARVSVYNEGEYSGAFGDNPSMKVEVGDSTQTWSYADETNTITKSNNFGSWFAHTGTSMSVKLSAVDMTGFAYYKVGEVEVEVYNPTIYAGGGGDLAETGVAGSGTAIFTVSRDLPNGWTGTPSGDSPIPDTNVSVQRGGTALFGSDYVKVSGSDDLPSTSVTLDGSTDHKTFSVKPIDDSVTESRPGHAEDRESIIWDVSIPADTSHLGGSTTHLVAMIADDSVQRNQVFVQQGVPSSTTVTVGSNTSEPYLIHTDPDIYQRDIEYVYYTKSYESTGLSNTSTEWGAAAHFSGTVGWTRTLTVALSYTGSVGIFGNLGYSRTAGGGTSSTATAADTAPAAANQKVTTEAFVEHRDYLRTVVEQRREGEDGQWSQFSISLDESIPSSDGTAYDGDMLGQFIYKRTYVTWLDEEANA